MPPKLKQCSLCERKFPHSLVHPMFTNEGVWMLCPLCALKERNRIHGISDEQFMGTRANELLYEAKRYLDKQASRN